MLSSTAAGSRTGVTVVVVLVVSLVSTSRESSSPQAVTNAASAARIDNDGQECSESRGYTSEPMNGVVLCGLEDCQEVVAGSRPAQASRIQPRWYGRSVGLTSSGPRTPLNAAPPTEDVAVLA